MLSIVVLRNKKCNKLAMGAPLLFPILDSIFLSTCSLTVMAVFIFLFASD